MKKLVLFAVVALLIVVFEPVALCGAEDINKKEGEGSYKQGKVHRGEELSYEKSLMFSQGGPSNKLTGTFFLNFDVNNHVLGIEGDYEDGDRKGTLFTKEDGKQFVLENGNMTTVIKKNLIVVYAKVYAIDNFNTYQGSKIGVLEKPKEEEGVVRDLRYISLENDGKDNLVIKAGSEFTLKGDRFVVEENDIVYNGTGITITVGGMEIADGVTLAVLEGEITGSR